MSMDEAADGMAVHVSNIGGIEELSRTFQPGISVLAGRNATNRTSLLRSLMAALGSEDVSLKGDCDAGSVELTVDGTTYTRRLVREDGTVSFQGEPYLDDPTVADYFAFLLHSNDARVAVARGDDLREIIMEPVDTGAIESAIRELEREKRELEEAIETRREEEDELSTLRTRLETRESAVAEKEDELAEKRAALADVDRDAAETRREEDELEAALQELRTAHAELENRRYRLETERESLEALREERAEVEAALEDLEDVSEAGQETLERELAERRDRRQALESEVNTLQQVIQFNEGMLEGTSADVARALRSDGGGRASGSVTDQLVAEQEVVCWTCGSPVETSDVESTLDRLRTVLREKHAAVREVESAIDELEGERAAIESKRERRTTLARRRDELDEEMAEREETMAELEAAIEETREEVDRLEETAESLEETGRSELLAAHREANELEFELERLREECSALEDEIAATEARVEEIEALESERSSVQSALTDRRTTIDRLEADAVEAFNDHMAEVLAILDYDNVERIWLERTDRPDGSGAAGTAFDLHVVRSTDAGTVYEDTVDHLSESEREVTGLVFALAGFLIHEVYDRLPVMLLDSLEAIDSTRIAALVEYFADYADYLLVALLPEDATALEGTGATIVEV